MSLGHVRLFATPWTVAHQAPLSVGFPRQESWCELPFPSPGDFPDPGIKPALQADSLLSELPGKPLKWSTWVQSQSRLLCCWKRVFAMTNVFFGKILLAFTLLHFLLQGQTCLLFQVSLDFLLLHSGPI